MSGLPIALLAFAAGARLLQWLAMLPPVVPWLAAAGALALVAVLWRRFGPRLHVGRGVADPLAVIVHCTMVAAAAGAFGFGYAAWRAETRLADALPPEWEGADITLVGIIDELPQMRLSRAVASASAGAAVHRRNVDAVTETPARGRGSDEITW